MGCTGQDSTTWKIVDMEEEENPRDSDLEEIEEIKGCGAVVWRILDTGMR